MRQPKNDFFLRHLVTLMPCSCERVVSSRIRKLRRSLGESLQIDLSKRWDKRQADGPARGEGRVILALRGEPVRGAAGQFCQSFYSSRRTERNRCNRYVPYCLCLAIS